MNLDVELMAIIAKITPNIIEKNLVVLDFAVFTLEEDCNQHKKIIKSHYPNAKFTIVKLQSGRFFMVSVESLPTEVVSIEIKIKETGELNCKIVKDEYNNLAYLEIYDKQGLLLRAKTIDVLIQWIRSTGIRDEEALKKIRKKLNEQLDYILYGKK